MMTQKTINGEKNVWYTDEKVVMPFTRCIILLRDTHPFVNFKHISNHINNENDKRSGSLVFIVADCLSQSINKAYLKLYKVNQSGNFYHLTGLKCNLHDFKIVDEFTEINVLKLLNTKNTYKEFQLI